MAGVHVRQLAGGHVEHRVEQRDEAVARRLPAHLDVQPRHQRGRLEPLVDERAHHREQQRHQQRRGTAFAGDVADGRDETAVAERQDLVEVAAHRVGRPAQSGDVGAGRAEPAGRQHRLLNLARDFEIVLERQPIGDFEQHEQVHQREGDEQRHQPVGQRHAGEHHVDAPDLRLAATRKRIRVKKPMTAKMIDAA